MQKAFSRCAFFAVPLAVGIAGWAGCTDETGGDTPAAKDAAPESSPAEDVFVPQDAPADAKRDCAADKQADGVQMHLDCTGLYSDFAAKVVAAENKAYTPAVPFWSDGAEKSRFLYLPPGAKIDITDFDEWVFPEGTKIWKAFKVGGKLIETRMYFKAKGSWRHTDYRWNDTETDAVRKDSGEKLALTGKPPYEVPNTGQCDACHNGRKEPVLGIDAVQLGLPGAAGITLQTLSLEGRFNVAPPVTGLTIPEDSTGKAASALTWLHANCGQCHNKSDNAGAQFTNLFFLLKPSQLLPDAGTAATVQDLDAYKTAVNVMSTKEDAGVPYVRIVPGDPGSSLVSILSGRRVPAGEEPNNLFQMPPLVTRVPDTQGHALLDAWITDLPP